MANDPRWRPFYEGMPDEALPGYYATVWLAWKEEVNQEGEGYGVARGYMTDRGQFSVEGVDYSPVRTHQLKAWAPHESPPKWPEDPVRQELTWEI
jgi:hypothetical protein